MKEEMLFILIEILSSLIPFIIVFFIIKKLSKRTLGKKSIKTYALVFSFAVYIIAVFSITGVGTLYNIFQYQFEIRPESINLIPFAQGVNISYILNIILFVPFGFLCPLIWSNNRSFVKILLSGFSFSLLIEISQLLNIRCTDIDDLAANTLGAVIGYVIFKIFGFVIKERTFLSDHSVFEPYWYILVMFIGRFFLFNEFGLAKMIYNF